MKLLKGMILGVVIATSVYMLYTDNFEKDRKKLMKTGKKVIRKMGIV